MTSRNDTRPRLSFVFPILAVLALGVAAALFIAASQPALAQSPPPSVGSVSVARADGTVTASWTAPAGASKYHVTYSTDNKQSWSLAAFNHSETSVTINNADNAKTYIVGVRSGNDAGWSGWVNSAPAGPYTQQQPPASVGSVSVARADGTVTASWTAPAGADKYHVTYSTDNRSSWSLAAMDHSGTSVTINNADNAKTYIVGVRAGNAGGWSGWVNSAPAGPYTPPPAAPTGLTIAADNQSLTLAWSNPSDSSITGYEYAVQQAGNDQGDWTAITGSDAATTSYAATGLTNGTAYTIHLRAVNGGGNGAAAQASATPNARGIIVQDSNGNAITALSVAEGGEVSYQVKLTAQPAQDVKVCVALSVRGNNDSDITFKGEASSVVAIDLTFTPDNWNTAQTATLVAAEDGDDVNGARDLGLDARTYYPGRIDLTVTEVDND